MPFESSSSAHGAGMCLRCKGMRIIITIATVSPISVNVQDGPGLKMRSLHDRHGRVVWLCHHDRCGRVVWLCHHYFPLNVQYVIVGSFPGHSLAYARVHNVSSEVAVDVCDVISRKDVRVAAAAARLVVVITAFLCSRTQASLGFGFCDSCLADLGRNLTVHCCRLHKGVNQ